MIRKSVSANWIIQLAHRTQVQSRACCWDRQSFRGDKLSAISVLILLIAESRRLKAEVLCPSLVEYFFATPPWRLWVRLPSPHFLPARRSRLSKLARATSGLWSSSSEARLMV